MRRYQFRLRTLFVVVALICVYLGAYRILINPIVVADESRGGGIVSGYRESQYHIGGKVARVAFLPVELIDRLIRPSYWTRYSDFD